MRIRGGILEGDTRDAVWPCGAYTQFAIAGSFRRWAGLTAAREGKDVSALDTAFPDGWTPSRCGPCDEAQLRREDPAPYDPMIVRTYQAPRRGMFGEAADD